MKRKYLIITFILLLAAGIWIPAVGIPSVKRARQNTCIGQLILIESAKAQWVLENKKTNGPVTWNDLLPYLGRPGKIPVCPAGGTYTLGNLEDRVRCSVPGHALTP